ncbi:hypothetical protein L917_10497 [Phytophthora nicotianae]|uniref:Uncharacterized protein n=1 Tax=Phytophthora nicotianae TaxID=4792 RepID=W2L235_PHYNI|nr:hypothetical protein L917_10497 [Phytophthora nicotianae]
MPVPPLYRGSSKQEKRDFMDSYMVYKRRVDALNQGTQTQVFVMPIGACIQQSTLVRICRFKLFKPKATVTEEDWKRYILGARNPDFTTYKQLDVAVRGLTVDVQLQDAESCMSRLLANFYSTVDGMNMESIIHEDPKRVVGYLVMPYVQRPIVLPSKKVWSALLLRRTPSGRSFAASWIVSTPGMATTPVAGIYTGSPGCRTDADLHSGRNKSLLAVPDARRVSSPAECGLFTFFGTASDGVGDILLSDAVMERLGYNPYKLIESAQSVQAEYDLGNISLTSTKSGVFAFDVHKVELTPEAKGLSEAEDSVCFTVPSGDLPAVDQVMAAFAEGIAAPEAIGAPMSFRREVEELLTAQLDVFRMALGGEPPVDMPPMRIKLKPGATPARCRERRYSMAHRNFLAKHIKLLLDAGLCCRNPTSEWCSPPHVVPKGEDHRMTVGVREPNKRVVPVIWPMPMLEVEFDRL